MNNFYLADSNSINLNFLIYIYNLYVNCDKDCEVYNIFPWLPIEKSIFNSEFEKKSKGLWNTILNSFSNDLIVEDLEYWARNQFPFDDLFSCNYEIKQYKNIKKSFEAWYYGTGHSLCCAFSDNIIKDFYLKMVSMAKSNGSELKDIKFYLQVVYDYPPKDWGKKNNYMIIISPNGKLPKVEEIFDICKI